MQNYILHFSLALTPNREKKISASCMCILSSRAPEFMPSKKDKSYPGWASTTTASIYHKKAAAMIALSRIRVFLFCLVLLISQNSDSRQSLTLEWAFGCRGARPQTWCRSIPQKYPHDLDLSWSPQENLQTLSELAVRPSPVGLNMLIPLIDGSIIAVHGLDGTWNKTWTAENGVFWLRDLIPQLIPDARVFSYGYDSRTRASSSISN